MLSLSPSEQKAFLQCVQQGQNIVCDAVAGGAKSTTALLAMAQNPSRRFFCFTYNRFLADSSNERVKKYGLDNSDFFTYHAAMNHLYDVDEVVKDDFLFNAYLEKIIGGEVRKTSNIHGIDVVVCDEAQDLRAPYYRFIQCLVRDTDNRNLQFIVIGSVDQLLYDFYTDAPADSRYLTLAPALYLSQREWVSLNLSVSFRLTPCHAAFANYLSGNGKITASNQGSQDRPVEVWLCDPQSVRTIQRVYEEWILPHPPGSVTLLFPSMDRRCRVVVNTLIHRYQLKIKIQSRDVPDGWTVTVSTFHAYKGLENALLAVLERAREALAQFRVTPGDHVGLQASQNCSEPLTQMTLNRFHFSGQKSSCVHGVTRTKEILHVNKNISAPTMSIPTKCTAAGAAELLASRMMELNLLELFRQWRCGPCRPRSLDFLCKWKRWRGVPSQRLRSLELELDRTRCVAVRLHPFDVASAVGGALKDHPDLVGVYERLAFSSVSEESWWLSLTFDTNEELWTSTAGQLQATGDDAVAGQLYTSFFTSCSVSLSGMRDVTDFFVRKEPGPRYTIHTQGSNLEELLSRAGGEDFELPSVECNHVAQVLSVLGIDAAQACMQKELEKVMGIDRYNVSSRHVQLIVANICSKGAIAPITYQGLCTGHSSVMKRASFEKAVDSFITGAVTGQKDSVQTVSDSVTWNAPLYCGTGRVRLVNDEVKSTGLSTTSAITRVADYRPPTELTKYIHRSSHIVQKERARPLHMSLPQPPKTTLVTSRPVREKSDTWNEPKIFFTKGETFIPSSPRPEELYYFCGPSGRFIPYSP